MFAEHFSDMAEGDGGHQAASAQVTKRLGVARSREIALHAKQGSHPKDKKGLAGRCEALLLQTSVPRRSGSKAALEAENAALAIAGI